jgi:hypothetical protein
MDQVVSDRLLVEEMQRSLSLAMNRVHILDCESCIAEGLEECNPSLPFGVMEGEYEHAIGLECLTTLSECGAEILPKVL